MLSTHVITLPIQFQTGARRGAKGEVEHLPYFALQRESFSPGFDEQQPSPPFSRDLPPVEKKGHKVLVNLLLRGTHQ